eukprot:scpid63915/ scgid23314/ 
MEVPHTKILPLCAVALVLVLGAIPNSVDGVQLVTFPGRTLPAYYLNGQDIASIGHWYMPICFPDAQSGETGNFIRLTNLNTSMVAGSHGAFSAQQDDVEAEWDTVNFRYLSPSYTGLYQCITDTASSAVTYQLNVVVPPNITRFTAATTAGNTVVRCTVTGFPEPNVALTIGGTGSQMASITKSNLTAGVYTKTYEALLSGVGPSDSVTCSVTTSQPAFACSPAQQPELQDRCSNAPTSASQTLNITDTPATSAATTQTPTTTAAPTTTQTPTTTAPVATTQTPPTTAGPSTQAPTTPVAHASLPHTAAAATTTQHVPISSPAVTSSSTVAVTKQATESRTNSSSEPTPGASGSTHALRRPEIIGIIAGIGGFVLVVGAGLLIARRYRIKSQKFYNLGPQVPSTSSALF